MFKRRTSTSLSWVDILWLVFLLGLAMLPPIGEIHKQLILLSIGLFQLFERELIHWRPDYAPALSVLVKIVLATLLLDHTGGIGINSGYYPIYYIPVITAAIYFRPLATFGWTAMASLAYCSYLVPALQQYVLTSRGWSYLAMRILFFFFAALLVNQFAMENRRQMQQLAESNRQLQKAQEEARRAERLAALGQLSAGLAHEIRNPLGVIKGSAEMLASKLRNAQPLEGELAGYISSEVNRLNSLVARFLQFARPAQLQLHPLQLPQVVDRAVAVVQTQNPNAENKIKVERDYEAKLPQVAADEQLCEQVFVNLIQNAYDAMGAAGGVLRISIGRDLNHTAAGIAVEVQDSGPGVPAALREQIFNPFFTSKTNGVGLGLSIVAKIVDDHGGEIRLTSAPGEGARFEVFLPMGERKS